MLFPASTSRTAACFCSGVNLRGGGFSFVTSGRQSPSSPAKNRRHHRLTVFGSTLTALATSAAVLPVSSCWTAAFLNSGEYSLPLILMCPLKKEWRDASPRLVLRSYGCLVMFCLGSADR